MAQVIIRKLNEHSWAIFWKITPESNYVEEPIEFSTMEIEVVFGLKDAILASPEEQALIQAYGGTTGLPGKFIRYEQWLNIIRPESRMDEDSNISIELTEDIQNALLALIGNQPR
jgi:hypothetical protein